MKHGNRKRTNASLAKRVMRSLYTSQHPSVRFEHLSHDRKSYRTGHHFGHILYIGICNKEFMASAGAVHPKALTDEVMHHDLRVVVNQVGPVPVRRKWEVNELHEP